MIPKKRKGFCTLPPQVVFRAGELTLRAIRAAIAIGRFMDAEGHCWPSDKTLARSVGTSTRAIQFGKAELRAAGLLSVKRRGTRSNIYRWLAGDDSPPRGESSAPTIRRHAANQDGIDSPPRGESDSPPRGESDSPQCGEQEVPTEVSTEVDLGLKISQAPKSCLGFRVCGRAKQPQPKTKTQPAVLSDTLTPPAHQALYEVAANTDCTTGNIGALVREGYGEARVLSWLLKLAAGQVRVPPRWPDRWLRDKVARGACDATHTHAKRLLDLIRPTAPPPQASTGLQQVGAVLETLLRTEAAR